MRPEKKSKQSLGSNKYERALELRLKVAQTCLLRLKAEVCQADSEQVEEALAALVLGFFIGPHNVEKCEERFRHAYPELSDDYATEQEQKIHIDCPPGDPRPDDLIPAVVKDTGLPFREAESKLFGWWTWDYADVTKDVWKKARPLVCRRLRRLYRSGIIRAGMC